MKEMSQTWEEKLVKTERLQHERQQALEKMGISVQASGIQVEKSKYYLVNLNDDPSLNELLVYYLKVCTCRYAYACRFVGHISLFAYPVTYFCVAYFCISGKDPRRRSFSQKGTGYSIARLGYTTGTLCYYDRRIRPIHDTVKWCSMFRQWYASCKQDSTTAWRSNRLGKPSFLQS